MLDLSSIPLLVAVVLATVAAIADLRNGTIPNWLTVPPLLLAPLAHGFAAGPGALGASLLGLGVCGAVPALLFSRGAMGGGDLKLFAALGAITGAGVGLEIQLGSLLLAAVYALGRLAWQGKLVRTLLNSVWLVLNAFLPAGRRREIRPELMTSLRMGGAILAASFLSFLSRAPWDWIW